MAGLNVGVVTRDRDMRLEVARAFDHAPASWAVTLHDSVPTDVDVLVFGPDVEAHGGIAFDPLEPAGVVRAITAHLEKERSAPIVVTSASGGTGVTTLALHLAAATSQWCSTCFIEVEALSGAALRLDLEEGFFRTWADLEGDDSLQSALPVSAGFRALLAPQTWGSKEFRAAVARAQASFEATILDAPFSCPWPLLPEGPFMGVVVMSPTVPSAHRTRAFLDGHCETTWAIVGNRLGSGGEMTRMELERILERKIALQLPCTPALRDAEDEGRLAWPAWSRYARSVVRLARALRSFET